MNANGLTYVSALKDSRLLGGLPMFRNLTSWNRWLVLLKSTEGLPLSMEEERIFCQHTGRSRYAPPAGGFREVVCIVGRQAGKDRIASVVQVVEAIRAEREGDSSD